MKGLSQQRRDRDQCPNAKRNSIECASHLMYHTNDLCRHHNKNLEQQQFVCFGRITIESCVQQSQTLPNRNRKLIRRKTNKINTILHLARSSMFQLIRVAGVVVIFFVSLSLSQSVESGGIHSSAIRHRWLWNGFLERKSVLTFLSETASAIEEDVLKHRTHNRWRAIHQSQSCKTRRHSHKY